MIAHPSPSLGPLETVDGQKLHKVEVSVDYVSSRDDYKLSMKCL
jgi:hypothetical protein